MTSQEAEQQSKVSPQASAAAASTPLDAVMQDLGAETETGHAQAMETTPEDGAARGAPSAFIPCIQVADSPVHADGLVYIVELFGPGCLDCMSLVEDAELDHKKCHFLQGNKACPAAYLKIGFVGERVKWENRVRKVLDLPKGLARTQRLLALVDSAREIESDALQEYVLGLLGL